MTDNFEYFAFSVFKSIDLQLQDIYNLIVELYHNQIVSGKAHFTSETFSIIRYCNPSASGCQDDIFTFWKDPNYVDFTFFVSNSIDGRYTLCNWLSNKINCDYLMCRMSSKNSSNYYPMNSFNYIKQGNLGTERCVLAYKDPKWTFFEKGEPANFENLQFYKNKYIKDRLNIDILKEYLLKYGVSFDKLGIDIQDYFTFRLHK